MDSVKEHSFGRVSYRVKKQKISWVSHNRPLILLLSCQLKVRTVLIVGEFGERDLTPEIRRKESIGLGDLYSRQ